MGNKTKILIVIGVVLIFGFLIYYFGRDTKSTVVSDDWYESYSPSDKGPYGTYMLKELLDTAGLFGNFIEIDDELEDVLEDDPEINDIYFFVGLINYLEESSCETLIDFVYEGNTAFISAEDFPLTLLDYITLDTMWIFDESDEVLDSMQHFKFTHSSLRNKRFSYTYIYNNVPLVNEWLFFDSISFYEDEEVEMKILGTNTKGKVNFVRIDYGDGAIFLHSTPYLFTNICLTKRNGFQYAEYMLEHIPPGRIQWDRYNLQPHYQGGNDGGEERRSMVEFLLKHPTLIWALCILLIGALLYAFFKGKRMQRIIPAAELKENTSMNYINTLSSLYLQEEKHNKLIVLKERTFLNFIAEKYYITCKDPDQKFIEKVAIKSQVSEDEITDIFKRFNNLKKVSVVSDESLIMLHKKIENFYKKCR